MNEKIYINFRKPLKEKSKDFNLGENHFNNFEYINEEKELIYNSFSSTKEFKILNILYEAYKKIDLDFIEKDLIQISNTLQKYNIKDINDLRIRDYNIFVKEGIYIQGAKYNPMTKEISIFLNRKCLQDIKDFKNIKNIIHILKSFFVHEGTHKQQDISSKGKFCDLKKYIDSSDTKEYINQRIEIDAYARQYGYELRDLYPEENTDKLFKRIFNRDIKDENLKNNLNFFFNNLTVENQKFFLRNIYDYLN